MCQHIEKYAGVLRQKVMNTRGVFDILVSNKPRHQADEKN